MREFALQPSPSGNPAALHTPVPRYELKVWEPILAFGGGTTGIAGTAWAMYQRIGNRVYLDMDVTLTAKGSSTGDAVIYNLPFKAWGNFLPFTIAWFNMTSTLVNMTGILSEDLDGNSTISLLGLTAAGASLVALTDAAFSDTTRFMFSGFYNMVQE